MNWGMIAAGMMISWIGVSMIINGDRVITRWLGMFTAVMVAGSLISIGIGVPEWAGWERLDKEKCSQYVWVDDTLTCVPYGEEG